jgi:hypothetical protein
MLNVYAAWVEGAKESDVEAIRVAVERTPQALLNLAQAARSPLRSPGAVTRLSLEPRQEGVSKRVGKCIVEREGLERRTRKPDQ